MEYIFVRGLNPETFSQEVTQLLSEGWALYGSPGLGAVGTYGSYMGQALVRTKEPSKRAGFGVEG